MNTKEIFLSLLILSAALFISIEPQNQAIYRTNGVETVDGDTVDVKGEINTTVRLLGVDTPETKAKNKPEEFKLQNTEGNRECLKKWGETATEFTENFTSSGNVKLRTDPVSDERGAYGRLLAYVEKDSKTLGEELLRKGYARVYEAEFTRINKYRNIAESAREKEKGLWSCN